MDFKYISVHSIFLNSVGKGWEKLLHSCLNEIDQLGINITITEIKEKFGSLRIYYDRQNEYSDINEIEMVISKYAKLSSETCEYCESTENLIYRRNYWDRTICKECSK